MKNYKSIKTQIIQPKEQEIHEDQRDVTYCQSQSRTPQKVLEEKKQYKQYFQQTLIDLNQITNNLRVNGIIYNKHFKYKREPQFNLTVEPLREDFSFVMINVTMGAFSTTLRIHFYQTETKLIQYHERGGFGILYHKSIQKEQKVDQQYIEKTFDLQQQLKEGKISKLLDKVKQKNKQIQQLKKKHLFQKAQKSLNQDLISLQAKIEDLINFMLIIKEYFFNKIAFALGIGPKLIKIHGAYDIIFTNKKAVFALRKYKKLCSKQFANNLVRLKQKVKLLHHLHIVHRDLKPLNLLVQNGQIYIIDFGTAEIIKEEVTQDSNFLMNAASPLYLNDHFYSFFLSKRFVRANLYYADVFALKLIEKQNWQVTTPFDQSNIKPNIILKSYDMYIKKRQQICSKLYMDLEKYFDEECLSNELQKLLSCYKLFQMECKKIDSKNLQIYESKDSFFYQIQNIFLANPNSKNKNIYQKFAKAYSKQPKHNAVNYFEQDKQIHKKAFRLQKIKDSKQSPQIKQEQNSQIKQVVMSFSLQDFYINLPLYPIKLKFLSESNKVVSNQIYRQEILNSKVNLANKSKMMALMSIFQFKNSNGQAQFDLKVKIASHLLIQSQIELSSQLNQQASEFQIVLKAMNYILNNFELEAQNFELNNNYLNLLSNFILINDRLQNNWDHWVTKIIDSVNSKKMKLLYLLQFKTLSMFGVFRQFRMFNHSNRNFDNMLIQRLKPILNYILVEQNKTIFFDSFEQFFISYFKGDFDKLCKHLSSEGRNQNLERLNQLFGKQKSKILTEVIYLSQFLQSDEYIQCPKKQRLFYEGCNIAHNSFNFMIFFYLLSKSHKGVQQIKMEITIFDKIIGCQVISKDMNLVLRFLIAIEDQVSPKQSQHPNPQLSDVKIRSYFQQLISRFQTFQRNHFQITNEFKTELHRLVYYLLEAANDAKYQIVLKKYLAEFTSLYHAIFKLALKYMLERDKIKRRIQLCMLQICQNFVINMVFFRLRCLLQPLPFDLLSHMEYIDAIDLFTDFEINGKFSQISKSSSQKIRPIKTIFEIMQHQILIASQNKNTLILSNIPSSDQYIDNLQHKMCMRIEAQVNCGEPLYTLGMISIYLNHQMKQNIKAGCQIDWSRCFTFIKKCFVYLNKKDTALDLRSIRAVMKELFIYRVPLNLKFMNNQEMSTKSQVSFCKYIISKLDELDSQIVSYQFILLRILRYCYDNKHHFQLHLITRLSKKIVLIFSKANALTNLKDQYYQIRDADFCKQSNFKKKLAFSNRSHQHRITKIYRLSKTVASIHAEAFIKHNARIKMHV